MRKKGTLCLIFLFVLSAFFTTATAVNSDGLIAFEKDFTITGWHLHISHSKFDVDNPGGGLLTINKITPDEQINGGFALLNDKFFFLKNFLTGNESVFTEDIVLKATNHLTVFLRGIPGASIIIEISKKAPSSPPEIIAFTAQPPSIKIGESSILTWQTQNAASCVIEPGNSNVDSNGSMPVLPTETTTYTLTAMGDGDLATAMVTVTIENSVPVAEAQTITTDEDTEIFIRLTGSDADGDNLTYEIIEAPAHGTLSGTAPNLNYIPVENYNGNDTFLFTASDGVLTSDTAMVSLTINPVNDSPLSNAGSDQFVFVGDTVSLNGSGSSDIDGDILNFQWSFSSVPSGSTAAVSDSSAVNPTFVPDFAGPYEVQLIVNDGSIDSAPDIVLITANPRMVTVPDVVGQIQADAEAAITGVNLMVGAITETSHDTVLAGRVINQQPAAGASIVEGSAVDLVISLGPTIQPPTVDFSVTPETIAQGESTTLSWNSTSADSAHIDNGIGIVNPSDSLSVSPDHTTIFTLTVSGSGGSASAQVTVTVTGNPEPQPEGSFGEQYEDLVPPDATVESYDPKRFSVITGMVRDSDDVVLPDVTITILGKPEYGTVVTDVEGRFSIPAEGGGTLTVVYQKQALLPVQRNVYVPWNDNAIAETVVMIAEDAASTTLTFDGNPDTVVTHKSADVTDESGTRSVSMVFSGDNRAYLVDEQGNDVYELTTITTRASEYPTPESMPAKLPPNSAFTYCAELSVDGVHRVRFDKPVMTYINNFLGFPVGSIVPVGYYDRDKGVWVPAENGVVVKLLDIDSDGVVDALDADGDDLPDDLDEDGSFTNEANGLDDNQLYTPDSTYWRVAITHFTPFDCNWPFGVPADAISSNAEGSTVVDQQNSSIFDTAGGQSLDDIQCLASFVEQRSRVFHEDIPIPGTDMTLHYASSRVDGYKPGVITVPVSGETVPDSLIRIIVQAYVAGKSYEIELPPAPNQIAEIEWDGLDYLGRPVKGSVVAHVRIGFVYYGVYYSPNTEGRAFGQAGINSLTVPTRREMTLWSDSKVPIIIGEGSLAEGWTLSAHHQISPLNQSLLLKGDGTISRNNASIIDTYAGDGSSSRYYGGMGGQATSAKIPLPSSLAMDFEGNLYIYSTQNPSFQNYRHYILKVDTQGIVTQFSNAQSRVGVYGYMALDSQGNVYYGAYRNWVGGANGGCIKKVTAEGHRTVVGACELDDYSFSGIYFQGIHIDNQGNIYTAVSTHQVMKMDTAGILTVVAGNGTRGSEGDGGPAVQAQLYDPKDVYLDGEGNLYIAEYERVRKVDPSGIITTVAGGGIWQTIGDGGPATEAYLYRAEAITMDAGGNLYIVEYYNNSVRKVDKNGIITTVAGINNDNGGYSGDGVFASHARLNEPTDVLIDPAGNLFIADMLNGRVRKVSPPIAGINQAMAESDIAFADKNGTGYIMSSDGRHKKTIDLNTGVSLYEFGYDEENNLIATTDQFGNQITIERDSGSVPTAVISPDGIRTELTIDANNQLDRIAFADGSYYEFEYTADGLMTAEIEPEGNRFEHIFNDKGRLTDVTDEEGGHWSYTRTVDANGDVRVEMTTAENNAISYLDNTASTGAYTSTVTDSSGAQTEFSKSGDGLTVNQSLPCGMDLEFIYDVDPEYRFKVLSDMTESTPSGLDKVIQLNKTYEDTDSNDIPDLITDTVTVNNKTTTLAHNTLQTQKVVTSPGGRTVTTLYNPNTLLTESVSVPGLFDTSYGYDTQGRLTSIATNTRQIAATYNAQGFLETVAGPENQTTTYNYDPVGRVTGISRPDGGFVGFTYDKNGNMTVLTNQVDVGHGFGFNNVNLNSSYQTPLSGSYSYIYDKDRRLIRTNFPSGNTIINDYADPLDPADKSRLWQIRTPEGNIDFTYLCGTKVESITKDTESISFEYDGKLITSETLSGTLNQSLNYSYNNDFDISSFTYAGAPVTYSYDNDGLLTALGSFTITRNADNGLPVTVTGGALNLARTFNGYGEVESQNLTANSLNVASWSLIRDNNGRITNKSETVDGTTSDYVYTYDSMGRLLRVTKGSTLVEEYQYDINGTRTYEMNSLRGISGRSYSYSDEDQLLSAGSMSYSYDLDGFLTTKTDGSDVTTYTYSSRGELLSANLPDGRVIEYIHDPLGRRIAKKVDGVIVEKYLWQGLTRLLAIYDGSDNLLMRFEYADSRMPVSMNAEGVTYYLTYDQVGSLRVVADGAGNVVKRIDYDSFGNIIDDTNVAFDAPFGFAGGLHDKDTGLVRFGYRDYDPDIGRWTAKDPILFAGGDTDLYGYVLNDPINLIDPLGLEMYRHGYNPKPLGQQLREFGNLLKPSFVREVDPGALKPGADSTTGPLAFYGAGSSLIITGAAVTKAGAGIMAGGGPVGWIGGSIITATGIVIWGSGVWTVYQGWNIDHSDPCQ